MQGLYRKDALSKHKMKRRKKGYGMILEDSGHVAILSGVANSFQILIVKKYVLRILKVKNIAQI